ncbi:fatty acid synthase-like [Leguminivora glycinivorella]|uniref:fatty acid synthase-like n=1 Tax=Leguminivora glycinivorella TaxID=1035111 RepID=UPI00200DEA30|nr:fatty acid synthase-like [Leguminivora glycinivorella]
MVPSPQERRPEAAVGTAMGDKDRVVISGISGLYPQSNNIKDLADILYNKENPVTAGEPRWKYDHPEVPPFVGTIPKIDCFDAQFFKVHYRLSSSMDPMGRKILEQAYQAIYDSGVSPEHLSGKKIGVFIGSCFSETEKASFYVASSRTGFGIAGCNKSMFANRVSYWLNAKGPSQSIDAACCSSTVALEQAFLAMTRGDCEAAIVGGSNLCLHPQSSIHYGRIICLCKDGKTKSYDQHADGCARSEAVNVLFLQKAKDALRIYADVVHVKNKFLEMVESDAGPRYGFYRDPVSMSGFLKEFYEEAKILPKEVEYVEGFGSGDTEADKVELEAFEKVFCENRSKPLLVGSVMSNLGYCEAASGITAITKVLLGYHKGEIAGNINCTTPRNDVDALQKGRMRLITDHQQFKRTYVGVNGMSVTGINSHVLLHGHFKPKDPTRYQCSFPRLVTISARQDVAVISIINDLKSRPIDPEELALLHNIHSSRISGHVGRGYVILGTDKDNKTIGLSEKASYCDASDRPLWFVYSGMGSQWTGMGKALMRIPIFKDAIERCHKVLEPKGVDLVHIITSPDKSIYDNILNSFVGIAAIQIGLTDILLALGLVPDKIIGHSVGELGCAYADGCLTAEEMILSAYSRGLVSVQTPFIRGSMAAVGIGFDKISKMCPPEIEVACHNGPDSCTISGPADAMSEFVAQLTAKGIFAKEVPCSNIAYHSRYIAEAGPALRKYLTEVISTPKLRSNRWVSTSVPEERWSVEAAKYSSAEYHTNNLLNPVLFEETSRLIPQNAVLVEVAPHGLLQAILKRSLPSSCVNIPLTRRGHSDNVQVLLEAIGQLYMEGYYPNVRVLYPKVEFPVSTGTPHLSHLVEWAHNETWFLPLHVSASRREAAACKFLISLHDSENNYLQGHVIQGKTVYPFAGALVAVWDTLAMSLGVARKQLSVQFRDVYFFAQPIMHDSRQLRLSVSLHRGTGQFEVNDDCSKVATGYVNGVSSNVSRGFNHDEKNEEALELTTDEVYKILFKRHYRYAGEFQSICSTNSTFTEGYLLWEGNWVTLLDGMLQLNVLRQLHEGISQPTYIRKITIDIKRHLNKKNIQINDLNVMKTNICEIQDSTSCEGILLEGIRFREIVPAGDNKLALKALNFVPRFQSVRDLKVKNIFQVFTQIVGENIGKDIINVVEIYDKRGDNHVFKEINTNVHDIPGIVVNLSHMHKSEVLDNLVKEADLILVRNLSRDDSLCQILYRLFHRNGFVVNAEDVEEKCCVRPSTLYSVVSAHSSKRTRLELVKWRPITLTSGTSTFTVRTLSDLALLQTARINLPLRQRMIVLTPYPMISGLKDLVKQWRSESERNQIFLLTFKNTSENLHIDTLPELDLAFNIINQQDEWGGEYFEPLRQKVRSNCGITLSSAKIGDLEYLRWIETTGCKGSGIPVKIHFAGPNFNDAKRAYGEIPFEISDTNDRSYGMDFSGTTEKGQRVMGVVRGGALSDRVLAHPELTWPVPDHWSLEDAATVPLPYAHAFYCLFIKIELQRGSSIIVHGGAGALGQAIISIALYLKCEIFVAVSDIKKKKYLLKLYPQLQEDHIGCSRDKNFSDLVLTHTNGKGCNVVITCGQGGIKTAFLKCCAPDGFTLDTSPLKSQENYMFGMSYMVGARTYASVDFASIFESPNKDQSNKLQQMVAKGIQDGYVRPLTRVSFMPEEATRAFKLLAASRHRGRILLHLQPALPQPECSRLFCSSDHCHVLIGDEEGLAVQLGDRLIKRGARTLHLHLPTPPSSHILKTWESMGIKTQISTNELKSSKDISNLLSDSWRMGPVEGIYVLITKTLNKQKQKICETLVDNLDLAARKTCPTIKYFAVIGIDNCVGQSVCLSRASQRLPAMMLQIPQEILDGRHITNAVEQGLCSQQSAIIAHIQVTTSQTLLDQLTAITGIPITTVTVGGNGSISTLQDLGILSDKSRAVSIFLRDKYNICIDDDKIPFLTVEKLKDIEEMTKECEYPAKFKQGLNALFTHVDPDELHATVELMAPSTYSHSSELRDDELAVKATLPFLFVVPGMEGHHHRYRLMCERLKLQAFVLQPGLDRPWESSEEMTARYVKIMSKKMNSIKRFYLLGYEMGVLTALEMATMLEDQGMTGTVFCLGGGPEDFLAALEQQLNEACAGEDSEQALQDAVARHMCALMGSASTQLETALHNADTWREKVEVSVNVLRGRVTYSAQYAQALIEAAYTRVTQARNARKRVQATPRLLESSIVLLRSPDAAIVSPHPLQRYTRLPLAIHDLRAPLVHATDDLRVAAVVNQYLDDEILQEFENKNICETYLLNADVFMTA